MRKSASCTVLAAGLLCLQVSVSAADVTIINPSFEDPALAEFDFTFSADDGNTTAIPGWVILVPEGVDAACIDIPGNDGAGVFNPTPDQYAVPIPDGFNVAFSRGPTISQILPDTLAVGVYRLEVFVGWRLDNEEFGFIGYKVEFGVDDSGTFIPLATDFNGNPPANGTFASSVVTYTATSVDPSIGRDIQIRLAPDCTQSTVQTGQVNFDLKPTTVFLPGIPIDIRPGDFPNIINQGGGGGIIPVAILGSATFDATTVDGSTCTLGDADVKVVGMSDKLLCSVEDVSGDFSGGPEGVPDGFLDQVCKFVAIDLGAALGDTTATLQCTAPNNIEGTDAITLVPPG